MAVAEASIAAAASNANTLMNVGGNLLQSFIPQKQTTTTSANKTTQKVFSEQAINQLIYNVLASDQGLASLAAGENLSGGFNSSSKTLQTQDFITKLIGELAIASAPTVEDSSSSQTTKKKATVICTELARQGLLDPDLYEAGGPASKQISYTTWVGYHSWAVKVVERMKKSERLCRVLLPIVESRYMYLVGAPGRHWLGMATIYIGHPVCWIIGTLINLRGTYGRASEFA